MTAKQEAWYQETLSAFKRGSSWEALKPLTWCAARLGIDPEQVVADARAAGKGERAADIRRGIRTAREKGAAGGRTGTEWTPRREERPQVYTGTVRDYVRAGDGAEYGDLLEISPFPVAKLMPWEYCAEWFRALWRPEDLLFITWKGARYGRLGQNIRPAAEWIGRIGRGAALGGDLVGANPYSGRTVKRQGAAGREYDSCICAECLAPVRPFLVAEFDELPEPLQIAFWVGFLQKSSLAPRLVSLVRSGGRSIHGLLYIGTQDGGGRAQRVGMVRQLFAVDPEERTTEGKRVHPYRLDAAAFVDITKTRIPGAVRIGTNVTQSMPYFNPAAAAPYRYGTPAPAAMLF